MSKSAPSVVRRAARVLQIERATAAIAVARHHRLLLLARAALVLRWSA